MGLTGITRKAVAGIIGDHLNTKPEYRGGINRLFTVEDWKIQLNESIIPEAKVGEVDEGFKVQIEFDAFDADIFDKLIEAGAIINDSCKLTISIDVAGYTDKSKENLGKVFESKKELILMAFGVEDGDIEITDDKVIFRIFNATLDAERINVYEQFCTLLNNLALSLKSASSKKTESDNPKFTFRVFLIRLGMIGDEYKTARKVLLERLAGNSAFRSGSKPVKEAAE